MIILFGLAGSGKGTQGKALSEIFGWRWISVGQALRETGEYAEIMNRGELVNDDDVNRLMGAQIEKSEAEGYDVILDGYPRDEYQAKWFLSQFAGKLDGAILLEVPKEELYERLALRGRDDDMNKESIDRRFEIAEQNFYSIFDLLKAENIEVQRVNGVGSVEEVTNRLVDVMKELAPNARVQTADVNGGEIERSYGE